MKVRDVVRMIENDGWRIVAQKGSHRQFKHPIKPGRVTIAGALSDELAGAREVLRRAEEELAATREEAQFLRERLTAQEAIIAQLAEAQSEAQRRRDVLEAQSRAALPEGKKRRWWPWGKG